MTTHTEKLIQDGLWRDISEAPTDGTEIIGYYEHEEGCLEPSVLTLKFFSSIEAWWSLPDFKWRLKELSNTILFAPRFFGVYRSRKFIQRAKKVITGYKPTHFRPLPNDRLANALKVAWDFINAIAFDDYKMQNHMEREDIVKLARQKREEIERIAKGE